MSNLEDKYLEDFRRAMLHVVNDKHSDLHSIVEKQFCLSDHLRGPRVPSKFWECVDRDHGEKAVVDVVGAWNSKGAELKLLKIAICNRGYQQSGVKPLLLHMALDEKCVDRAALIYHKVTSSSGKCGLLLRCRPEEQEVKKKGGQSDPYRAREQLQQVQSGKPYPPTPKPTQRTLDFSPQQRDQSTQPRQPGAGAATRQEMEEASAGTFRDAEGTEAGSPAGSVQLSPRTAADPGERMPPSQTHSAAPAARKKTKPHRTFLLEQPAVVDPGDHPRGITQHSTFFESRESSEFPRDVVDGLFDSIRKDTDAAGMHMLRVLTKDLKDTDHAQGISVPASMVNADWFESLSAIAGYSRDKRAIGLTPVSRSHAQKISKYRLPTKKLADFMGLTQDNVGDKIHLFKISAGADRTVLLVAADSLLQGDCELRTRQGTANEAGDENGRTEADDGAYRNAASLSPDLEREHGISGGGSRSAPPVPRSATPKGASVETSDAARTGNSASEEVSDPGSGQTESEWTDGRRATADGQAGNSHKRDKHRSGRGADGNPMSEKQRDAKRWANTRRVGTADTGTGTLAPARDGTNSKRVEHGQPEHVGSGAAQAGGCSDSAEPRRSHAAEQSCAMRKHRTQSLSRDVTNNDREEQHKSKQLHRSKETAMHAATVSGKGGDGAERHMSRPMERDGEAGMERQHCNLHEAALQQGSRGMGKGLEKRKRAASDGTQSARDGKQDRIEESLKHASAKKRPQSDVGGTMHGASDRSGALDMPLQGSRAAQDYRSSGVSERSEEEELTGNGAAWERNEGEEVRRKRQRGVAGSEREGRCSTDQRGKETGVERKESAREAALQQEVAKLRKENEWLKQLVAEMCAENLKLKHAV